MATLRKTTSVNSAERKSKNQGMNWIKPHKRLSIYMRDGFACAYCGARVEEGTQLTLDHLVPYSVDKNNHESNLITACHKCNSSRGNRSVLIFSKKVAEYLGNSITPADIRKHIRNCIARPLNTKEAKQLIDHRGSCFKVLEEKYQK